MDGGAWWAAVHGVAKSQPQLSDFTFTFHFHFSLSLFTFMHWRKKWQPTPVFLPGESQGQESLVGCHLWGYRVGHYWSDLAAAAVQYYLVLTDRFKVSHEIICSYTLCPFLHIFFSKMDSGTIYFSCRFYYQLVYFYIKGSCDLIGIAN